MSKKKTNGQAVRSGASSAAGLPFWGWFLIGLASGLLIALIAMWPGWLPSLKEADRPQPNPTATAPISSEPGIAETPKTPEKPKYDFYSVLPEMETVVPDEELASAENNQSNAAPNPSSRYFLQAGSYQSPNDAESAKAALALLGLKASLQTVTINDVTWHRVRVGPFDNTRDLEDARQTLGNNGIKAIALKESVTP